MQGISVIIPHKNCVDILIRCIKSIPNTPNIEIIVVDDNSDNQELLQEKISALNYCNLNLVLTHDGKGAGFARNEGLKIAKGGWLCFSDADDLFTSNAFNILKKYTTLDYDIVYFRHNSVYSDTLLPCVRFDERNEIIDQCVKDKSLVNLNRLRFKDVVPWAKIFRRDLVVKHNIFFDEVPASNDVMFVMQAGYYAKSVDCSNELLYTVTYRDGSITRIKSVDNLYSSFCVVLRYNDFVRTHGYPQFTQRLFGRILLVFRMYGIKKAIMFLNTAHKQRQWLFTGGLYSMDSLKKKILTARNKDNFNG